MSRCRELLLCAFGAAACLEHPDVVAVTRVEDAGVEDSGTTLDAAAPELLDLTGDLTAHDPALAFDGEQYRLFWSGTGLPTKLSPDLMDWQDDAPVFAEAPAWIATEVPDAEGFWSPDLAFFGGVHHLYYAVSTFGEGRSCIGHATSETLSPGAWEDRGPVICSNTGDTLDDWNAIDPTVLVTIGGDAWLAFGSYRSGIKLIPLDASGARADDTLTSIAARPDAVAIQASELTYRDGFFYLFVSFDECCLGADSTHRLMVGRAAAIEGPYLDRDDLPLLEGGGTLVLEGDERWRGPGSNDVFVDGSETYNVFHAYDADNAGRPTLRISTLSFDEAGWPLSAGP